MFKIISIRIFTNSHKLILNKLTTYLRSLFCVNFHVLAPRVIQCRVRNVVCFMEMCIVPRHLIYSEASLGNQQKGRACYAGKSKLVFFFFTRTGQCKKRAHGLSGGGGEGGGSGGHGT